MHTGTFMNKPHTPTCDCTWCAEKRSTQVGGDHYRTMPFQPLDFILANKLGWCEGNIVKYVCRWKAKNGVEDLEKARQYLDRLIESAKLEGNST